MNVLVEMIKMAAVVKGGMTNDSAEAIGSNIEAVIEKIDALINSAIVANETAAVASLLMSSKIAVELKETELAAALLGQAGDMVMGEEDEAEETELSESPTKS
jgi:hypothetical protein